MCRSSPPRAETNQTTATNPRPTTTDPMRPTIDAATCRSGRRGPEPPHTSPMELNAIAADAHRCVQHQHTHHQIYPATTSTIAPGTAHLPPTPQPTSGPDPALPSSRRRRHHRARLARPPCAPGRTSSCTPSPGRPNRSPDPMKWSREDPQANPGQKDARLAAAVLGSTAGFLRRWRGQRVEEGRVAARSGSRLPSRPDGSNAVAGGGSEMH